MKSGRILGINAVFLKDVSVVTFGKLLSAFIKFLLRIFVLRYLTKEDYGVISTLSAFVVYFDLLADFSINPIINKQMIEKSENRNQIFSTYLTSKLILGIFSSASFLILSYFMGYFKFQTAIVFIALNIFFNSISNIPEVHWQASSQFKKLALANIVSVTLGTILSAAIILSSPHFNSYFISILSASIIALILKFFFLGQDTKIKLHHLKNSISSIIPLIKKSLPLTIGSIFYLICYRSDIIIMERLDSLENVAEYNAAFAVLDQIADVAWAQFLVVLYPKMVQMNIDSNKNFINKIFKMIWTLIPIILIATLLSYFFSPFVFKILFSEKYELSGYIFTKLIPAQGLFIIFSIFLRVIIIQDKLWYFPAITLLGAVLSVMLNTHYIPIMSKDGAILTLYITSFVISLCAFLVVKFTTISQQKVS